MEDQLAQSHKIMAEGACNTIEYCNMREGILKAEFGEECIAFSTSIEYIGRVNARISMWHRCGRYRLVSCYATMEKYAR